MEIIHDPMSLRRYSPSTSAARSSAGTYYLEVNANHPDYILRTRILCRFPLIAIRQAGVGARMHYIVNVGGHPGSLRSCGGGVSPSPPPYVRTQHRSLPACTRPGFSSETNLVTFSSVCSPIRSKSARYVVGSPLYNSITPLYGNDEPATGSDSIAEIPLRSQGKPGSILLDFTSSPRSFRGSGPRPSERFGLPFLGTRPEDRRRHAGGRAQWRRAAGQQVALRLCARTAQVLSEKPGRPGRSAQDSARAAARDRAPSWASVRPTN